MQSEDSTRLGFIWLANELNTYNRALAIQECTIMMDRQALTHKRTGSPWEASTRNHQGYPSCRDGKTNKIRNVICTVERSFDGTCYKGSSQKAAVRQRIQRTPGR